MIAIAKHLLIFLSYLGLTVLMSWPLTARMATHITGMGGDAPIFLWNAWWFKQVLVGGQDLLETSFIYFPHLTSLITHTLVPINSFFIALGSLGLNDILAFNIYFLLSAALNGFMTYLLVRELTASERASWLSGIAFMFAPYLTAHWLGHQNLITLWFIPLFLWLCFRLIKNPQSWRYALWAGVVAGIASINDFYNALFLSLLSGLFLLWLWLSDRKLFTRHFVQKIGVVMVTWVLVWSVWLVPAVSYLQKNLDAVYKIMSLESISDMYSADLARYFVPSFLHTIWTQWAHSLPEGSSGGVEGTIFIGGTVLILAFGLFIYALRSRSVRNGMRSFWFWIAVVGGFGVLSLGPHLKILGHTFGGLLPYGWLYYIFDFWGNFRVPARFSIIVMLALVVLMGFAIGLILKHITSVKLKNFITVGLAVIIFFEFSVWPYPTLSLVTPAIYSHIAAQDNVESVLDLPWGINSGYWERGEFVSKFIYWATHHGKKIVTGSVSRAPEALLSFYNENQAPMCIPNRPECQTTQTNFPSQWKTDGVLIHKDYFEDLELNSYDTFLVANGYILDKEDVTHRFYVLSSIDFLLEEKLAD